MCDNLHVSILYVCSNHICWIVCVCTAAGVLTFSVMNIICYGFYTDAFSFSQIFNAMKRVHTRGFTADDNYPVLGFSLQNVTANFENVKLHHFLVPGHCYMTVCEQK